MESFSLLLHYLQSCLQLNLTGLFKLRSDHVEDPETSQHGKGQALNRVAVHVSASSGLCVCSYKHTRTLKLSHCSLNIALARYYLITPRGPPVTRCRDYVFT